MNRCKLLQKRNYLNKTTCTRYGHYNVNMYMFLSLLSLSLCSLADSKITGAFVVPHGGIALAPNHFNTTNATAKEQAWILHKNYRQIGDQIDRSKPDLIFLSTPHGVADLDRFALYLNSAGEGNANTDNIQCPPACFNVSANLAFNVAKDIVRKFNYGFNLTGLSAFGQPGKSDENFPLRWGEVIPLYFIPNLPRIQVIILSQPSRRYTDSVSMIPELLELGVWPVGRDTRLYQSVGHCSKLCGQSPVLWLHRNGHVEWDVRGWEAILMDTNTACKLPSKLLRNDVSIFLTS